MITDPFPYAVDECFDTYRVIAESAGRLLGMNGSRLNVILTGDSAYVLPKTIRFLA